MTTLTRRGNTPARVQTRARILLLLHRGRTPDAVAAALEAGVATVFNIKRRYLSEGLTSALRDKTRSGKPASIDGAARARITALACIGVSMTIGQPRLGGGFSKILMNI